MSNYHWFTDEEVTKWKLTGELWAGLDMARQKTVDLDPAKKGVPFVITNGLETTEHNKQIVGAVSDSAHLPGEDGLSKAADLATFGDHHIFNRIIVGLCLAGLGDRVGLYFSIDPEDKKKLIPHHIHVDIDKTKPMYTTWFLMEQN